MDKVSHKSCMSDEDVAFVVQPKLHHLLSICSQQVHSLRGVGDKVLCRVFSLDAKKKKKTEWRVATIIPTSRCRK